ncbi:MAG: acetyl-CoA carboxylase biotin carboxyl carrier protein [Stellaceae bacterium]
MRFGGRPAPLLPDPELIRTLARLLAETGLSEIEYSFGECRIRVARNGNGEHAGAAPLPVHVAAVPLPAAAADPADGLADHPGAVKSPMVGTVYLAPQPGAPPFVRPGESVAAGQALLIIEAMKVMNQIRAPRTGRIERILVRDGEPVEYGAVLLLIA